MSRPRIRPSEVAQAQRLARTENMLVADEPEQTIDLLERLDHNLEDFAEDDDGER